MRRESPYFKEAAKIVPDVAAILTAIVIFAMIFLLGKLIVASRDTRLSDYASALAVLAAAVTIGISIWVQRRTQAFNESTVYLRDAVALIEKAREVLGGDGAQPTNNRIAWVTAARLLTRSEDIASRMSVNAHKLLYVAEHDYQRHKFGELLRWNGRPLSAAFFAGSKNPTESIGDAVTDSSQSRDGSDWIPTRIVATVYRFSQYPQDYADPLEATPSFSESEIDRLWLLKDRGVCDYVTFRETFVPVGNQILRKGVKPTRYVANAAEIDEVMRGLSGIRRGV